jgi:hypothetical protein
MVVLGLLWVLFIHIKIDVQPCTADLHVPYWVGFYGSPTNLQIVVIDAVRRCVEGSKVRPCLREWMAGREGQ